MEVFKANLNHDEITNFLESFLTTKMVFTTKYEVIPLVVNNQPLKVFEIILTPLTTETSELLEHSLTEGMLQFWSTLFTKSPS